jgi:L-methionine (R)-S-oxide reductase
MFHSTVDASAPKPELYGTLAAELEALLAGETDALANLSNAAALLGASLPGVLWTGFYLRRGEQLVLGPFQGKPACVRIPMGRGVCGTAAARGETLIVPDVRAFPGHISCDPDSRSEIVVPLLSKDGLAGVLDLDSPMPARFDEADRRGLEAFARVLTPRVDWEQLLGGNPTGRAAAR